MLHKERSSLFVKIIAGFIGLAFVGSLIIGVLPSFLGSKSQQPQQQDDDLSYYAPRVNELEKVLKENPNQPNVLYELGSVYYRWGSALEQAKKPDQSVEKYDKASRLLQKSLDLKPNGDLLALMGNVFFDWGKTLQGLGKKPESDTKFQQAIEHYQRYLAINPSNGDVRTDMGIAYFERGDIETAISQFNKAIETNPQHAKAWFNLGFVSDRAGKKEEAIRAWKRYLELEQNGPSADYVRGKLKELETKK